MKKANGTVYAEAFGGDFPVCNEKQALEMERAYKDAVANSEASVDGCTCDLITTLLSGKATREQMFTAAAAIAQDIYMKKLILSQLTDAMQEAVLKQPVRPGETVH